MKKILLLTIVFTALFINSFSQVPRHLKLLNQFTVPFNYSFKSTTVGGLSGIDYNKNNDCYYFISDDRSAINPARIYTAKINVSDKGIDTVIFTDVITLTRKDSSTYPNSKTDAAHTPDPESIRYDAASNQLVWSSEGERIVTPKDTILEHPAITITNMNGEAIDTFPLPAQLYMHSTKEGPRQNGVLEGLAFTPDYATLYASVEEPLYQDGERAGLDSTQKTYCRIIQYDVATKKSVAQYAYPLDPVAYAPKPAGSFMVNGISEIIWVAKDQLIAIERSYSTGRLSCTVKLYLVNLSKAYNIQSVYSLTKQPPTHVATKKLLLNMDNLARYIDNVEGITYGPKLPNGHSSIILVSDNNFFPFQQTQLFLFEVF